MAPESDFMTPPPARSALPPVLFVRDALLSAECLYHEISHAAAAHDQDSGNTDNEVQPGAAGDLGQHEMPGKRQEHAEAENLQRMLPAQDQRPQPGRFQPGPVLRQEAHGDRRQRQEMREPQHVEIGLVDRIHPLLEPARHQMAELRHVPGQRDAERREQIGERNPQRDRRRQDPRHPPARRRARTRRRTRTAIARQTD